jgi:hypothetical protein
MRAFRRRLAWVAFAWLACQAAATAAAPLLLSTADVSSHAERRCECPVGDGQACPMHKPHKPEADNTCKMRNAFAPTDGALLGLSGGVGVLPSPTVTVSVFDHSTFVQFLAPAEILRGHVPDSPPPRA